MIYDDIETSILENKVIEFVYESEKGIISSRRGEPYEITRSAGSDKLLMWDYKRDAIRSFKIDNISDLDVTTETFIPRHLRKTG